MTINAEQVVVDKRWPLPICGYSTDIGLKRMRFVSNLTENHLGAFRLQV